MTMKAIAALALLLISATGNAQASRLRIPEHQIENEGEQRDETEHDCGLDVHVNTWWQVISITVANYGSASCAVCTVADRQTGKTSSINIRRNANRVPRPRP